MSVDPALGIGATGAVGRATVEARSLDGVHVLAAGRERDTTDPAQVASLFADADPDLVLVAGGAGAEHPTATLLGVTGAGMEDLGAG